MIYSEEDVRQDEKRRAMPLYEVEARASLGDGFAVEELARRRAESLTPGYKGPTYRAKWAAAWLKGWRGDANPWAYGRGGNFAAAWRSAYDRGQRSRRELDAQPRADLQETVRRADERRAK